MSRDVTRTSTQSNANKLKIGASPSHLRLQVDGARCGRVNANCQSSSSPSLCTVSPVSANNNFGTWPEMGSGCSNSRSVLTSSQSASEGSNLAKATEGTQDENSHAAGVAERRADSPGYMCHAANQSPANPDPTPAVHAPVGLVPDVKRSRPILHEKSTGQDGSATAGICGHTVPQSKEETHQGMEQPGNKDDKLDGHVPEQSSARLKAAHGKFFQDPSFGGRRGRFGGMHDFDHGIGGVVGRMSHQPLRQTYAEHCLMPDSKQAFRAPNASTETTPEREWAFVVGSGYNQWSGAVDVHLAVPAIGGVSMAGGRNAKPLADLLAHPSCTAARLCVEELIALRLYTGPMYHKYNQRLRGLAGEETHKHSGYGTTINLIVSALVKLGRVGGGEALAAAGDTVFRGMGNMALGNVFFDADEQGFAGGVELGLMSTTQAREVALQYSGVAKGKAVPTVLELRMGKTATGADVTWLSQFEAEREILFPPLTHLQVEDTREERGVLVIRIKPTVNQHFHTLEEVVGDRRRRCLDLAHSLVDDIRHEAVKQQRARLQLLRDVAGQEPGWFNDNAMFKAAYAQLFHSAEKARTALLDDETVTSPAMAPKACRDASSEQREGSNSAKATGAQSKFSQAAVYGNLADFDRGIERYLGGMDRQPGRALFAEHCMAADSHTPFQPSNSNQSTTPAAEWAFIVGEEGVDHQTWQLVAGAKRPSPSQMSRIQGRERAVRPLREVLREERVLRAGVTEWEVIALVLYTGPMFYKYNAVLRGVSRHGSGAENSSSMDTNGDGSGNSFATSILLIVSGLLKLSRVSPPVDGRCVFRGFGGRVMPQDFFSQDALGRAGGVEFGLMSTSLDREVALEYSAGRLDRTLFEIRVGKTSMGSDISFLSQAPAEREILYPPFSFLELQGTRAEGDVTVIEVELTINQHFRTFEEVQRARIEELRDLITSLEWDVRHWACRYCVEGLDVADAYANAKNVLSQLSAAEVNENVEFARRHSQLIDASERARDALAAQIYSTAQQTRSAEACERAVSFYQVSPVPAHWRLLYHSQAWSPRKRVQGVGDNCHGRDEGAVGAEGSEEGAPEAYRVQGLACAEVLKAVTRPRHCQDLVSSCPGRQQRIVEIRTLITDLAPDGVAGANNLLSLGLVLWGIGQPAEAINAYQTALALQMQVHGREHGDVAASYLNLGTAYKDLGYLDEAMAMYNESLDISSAVLGIQHKKVADCQLGIANILTLRGAYKEALERYQLALEVNIKNLGTEHQDVAMAHMNIGSVYANLGRATDAVKAYEEAKTIGIRVLGPEHPLVGSCWMGMGNVHISRGENAEALQCYEEAKLIKVASLGPDHQEVAGALSGIGNIHAALGDCASAAECHSAAKAINEARLGPETLQVAGDLINLGAARRGLGDAEGAVRSAQEAIGIVERQVPSGQHVYIAEALRDIGVAKQSQGDAGEGAAKCKEAYAMYEALLGPHHPDALVAKACLGVALYAASREEEAVAVYEGLLPMRGSLHGLAAEQFAELKSRLGRQ